VFEDGDPELIAAALENVARAKGLALQFRGYDT
jgi:DNA-binding phage protein